MFPGPRRYKNIIFKRLFYFDLPSLKRSSLFSYKLKVLLNRLQVLSVVYFLKSVNFIFKFIIKLLIFW